MKSRQFRRGNQVQNQQLNQDLAVFYSSSIDFFMFFVMGQNISANIQRTLPPPIRSMVANIYRAIVVPIFQ